MTFKYQSILDIRKPGRRSVVNKHSGIKMFSCAEPANYANLLKCVSLQINTNDLTGRTTVVLFSLAVA